MMDFKTQVEKTVARAAKTANELKEISKIKYSVYDLNQDVKKLYTEIGKNVYEQMHDSDALSEDVRVKMEILDAKLAKIEALRAKEKQVKNHKPGVYCGSCGRFCELTLNYCPDCGAELAEVVNGEAAEAEAPRENTVTVEETTDIYEEEQ